MNQQRIAFDEIPLVVKHRHSLIVVQFSNRSPA